MSTNATSGSTPKREVYLDYAATTPTDPRVLEAMLPYFDARFGNASSMYRSGRRAAHAIADARGTVARILGSGPEEILFTGSGTESDNLAILGTARANRAAGRHVIVSAIEHKAVLESAKQLEREGFEVSIAPVHANGLVDLNAFEKLLRSDTVLVSIMYANNEVGTIEPIAQIAAIIKKYRGQKNFPLLHTDACQAAGLLPLSVQKLGVDLMTINGSKIYGPKGVGLLYKKKSVLLEPIIVGGEQERGLRAGTESVPLIVGLAEALSLAEAFRDDESARLIELRDYFIAEVRKKIPGASLNGHERERLPNNAHFSFPHIEGESILLMLDQVGVEVSTGSACSARDLKPSYVLLALGQNAELAHGSVRFTLGRHTSHTDIDYVLSVLPGIVERLSSVSALTATI
ncbi:MAG: cysteine desulfurase family protein [Minisyncoccia bacterium]|jgi:cysteine desulfurase